MADGRRTETSRGLVHLQFWFLLLGDVVDKENTTETKRGLLSRSLIKKKTLNEGT